jgi:hypothetical protein
MSIGLTRDILQKQRRHVVDNKHERLLYFSRVRWGVFIYEEKEKGMNRRHVP